MSNQNNIIQDPNHPERRFSLQYLLRKSEKSATYQAQQFQGELITNTVLLKIQSLLSDDEKILLESLKSTQDPPLIRVYDIFPFKEEIVIIMESGTQDSFQNKSLIEKANICIQISKQIQKLHSLGYLSGHLTPQSFIKVDQEWKLFNFEGITSKSQWTPHSDLDYTAPELFSDHIYMSEKSDVWSLGCIFYEIIQQKQLFPNGNNRQNGNLNIDLLNISDAWKLTLKQMILFDFNQRISLSDAIKKLASTSIITFSPLKSTPNQSTPRITGIGPQQSLPFINANTRQTQGIPSTQNLPQIHNIIQIKPFVPFQPNKQGNCPKTSNQEEIIRNESFQNCLYNQQLSQNKEKTLKEEQVTPQALGQYSTLITQTKESSQPEIKPEINNQQQKYEISDEDIFYTCKS